jgi:hypothetical protein
LKFFANLKRLLDRPPPPESAPPREPAPPDPIPAVAAGSDVQAPTQFAEGPDANSESSAQVSPPAAEPTPALPPASIEATIDVPQTTIDVPNATIDVPNATPDLAEGALILTLATPAVTFTVARSGATLGRGEENTIRLEDLSVSRRHARITYRGGGFWLNDLGSMGGTWVDGAKLNAPRRIAAGQIIDIGVCRLTVSFAADPVKADTKKSASRPRSEMVGQGRRRR